MLTIGIATMALFSNNDSSAVAQHIIAHFLQKPLHTIQCTVLTGGSEEDTVLLCLSTTTPFGEYIIKLFNPKNPGINEITWTQLASNLGIGPKFYEADPAGMDMITAVAPGASLTPIVANTSSVIQNIAKSLATLHYAHTPFALASDMYERINAKYVQLKTEGPLQEMLQQAFQRAITIKDQFSSYTTQPVPCHNDLNPGNIFVYGDQITLIDWVDAALGNPYYDIAAFLVLNVIDADHEKIFLAEYNAQVLNKQLYQDLQLYKQLVYFEFALNLLRGVIHSKKSQLLHAQYIIRVEPISHYLTLLAKREVAIDENFLYEMALASIHEMINRSASAEKLT